MGGLLTETPLGPGNPMTPGCPLGPPGPGGPGRPSCPEIPYNHRGTKEKYYISGVSIWDGLGLALTCLWDRTYSRSNFSIWARASRATSHTLEKKKDKVNVQNPADTGKLPFKKNVLKNPPWIQVHQERQGFQTHRWLPEVLLGQGNHAHQGHPVKRECQE